MSKKNYYKYKSNTDLSIYDHLIIGSGIGGLTVATFLAKSGYKVAVIEQHYVPGGFMHAFKRKKGFKWDVGVHYIGGVGQEDRLKKIFDYLANDKLEWDYMSDIYDIAYISGELYEFKAGKENFIKKMNLYFPDEKNAINKYLKLINQSNKRTNLFFIQKVFKPILSNTIGWIIRKRFEKFSKKTTYEILKTITNNKKLISVLCAQFGDYGLTPKHSSFSMHALVVAHYMDGGYYPSGGPDNIVKKIIDNINLNEGRVYVNAKVNKIIVENNRVKGIMIGKKFIETKSVFSNVGVNNTFNYLLSEKERKICGFELDKVNLSCGHFCLYVGLDNSDLKLKLPKHNIWWHKNYDFDKNFDNSSPFNASDQFAYISFPSSKDSYWMKKNPDKVTIQMISYGKYEWFKKYEDQPWMKRSKEYKKMKVDFKNKMLKKLYNLFPETKGRVVQTEVSTPLSTKHFTQNQKGEIYGLEHTPNKFSLPFLRTETKIKGLRLVGQDITTVGVSGAMLSGLMAATVILKFKFWKVFKNIINTTSY